MSDLKNRFKIFAIDVGELIKELRRNTINNAYGNNSSDVQVRPGINYRAACRGKSTADYINQLKIVEEELDETCIFWNYWIISIRF